MTNILLCQAAEVRSTKTFTAIKTTTGRLTTCYKITDLGIIKDFNEITGVGHRVVAGGEWFNHSVVVQMRCRVSRLADYAPLITQPMLWNCAFQSSPSIHQWQFDTSFHQAMPDGFLYALPYEYYTRYSARSMVLMVHRTDMLHRVQPSCSVDLKAEPMRCIGAGASITL